MTEASLGRVVLLSPPGVGTGVCGIPVVTARPVEGDCHKGDAPELLRTTAGRVGLSLEG